MEVPYEWEEETKVVDPAVYQAAAEAGIVACLAWGSKIPKEWAKEDGTVFGGVKAEEWDGLCVVFFFSRRERRWKSGEERTRERKKSS